MRIAVTGATGFLGHYIVNHLLRLGHECRCWYRPHGDRDGFDENSRGEIEWVPGELGDARASETLVEGVDAVVHAGLARAGTMFGGGEGDLLEFVSRNIDGTIRLIQDARHADARRFLFISSCAVHDVIPGDRPLDEAHPLWPKSHYGAYKAAVEAFVHSFGLGEGYEVCSLRPTGIYGLARPVEESKWYDLVHTVAAGKAVASERGGKEVHAEDVARAAAALLTAHGVAGQAYNCYDMYVSDQMVARIAKELSGSNAEIADTNKGPKNQIETGKLRALGVNFGGEPLLRETIRQMLESRTNAG
jgi:nucleoside-diphosphate-sugar epimerase